MYRAKCKSCTYSVLQCAVLHVYVYSKLACNGSMSHVMAQCARATAEWNAYAFSIIIIIKKCTLPYSTVNRSAHVVH